MKLIATVICLLALISLPLIGYSLGINNILGGRSSNPDIASGGGYGYTYLTGSGIATTTFADTYLLGSIIITEDTAQVVTLYDATSTDAVGNGITTTIVALEGAFVEGVYTFNVELERGLVIDVADGFLFAGNMMFTYR